MAEKVWPQAEVAGAMNLAQARKQAQAPLDLALIDLELPDGSGVELITELAVSQPQCMCVVVTLFDDDEHLFAALRAGAQGYLLKDQKASEIAASLAGIVQGKPPLSPAIARHVLESFCSRTNGSETLLSPKEQAVLGQIAADRTLADAADRLDVSRNTVAFHVKNIYRKLRVCSRAEALNEAARIGLLDS